MHCRRHLRVPLNDTVQTQDVYLKYVKRSSQSSRRSFWIIACVDSFPISLNLSVWFHSATASRSEPERLLFTSSMCTMEGRFTHCPIKTASPMFNDESCERRSLLNDSAAEATCCWSSSWTIFIIASEPIWLRTLGSMFLGL